MLYKNIKMSSNAKSYTGKKISARIDFIFDSKNFEKELKKFAKKRNIELSAAEIKNFTSKKTSEIFTASKTSSPDYYILRKLKADKLSTDTFRDYLSGLIPKIEKKNITELEVNLPAYTHLSEVFDKRSFYFQSAVEGLLLGNYVFDNYKTEKSEKLNLSVNIISEKFKNSSALISSTKNLIDSVYFARDLVNEPANVLTPLELVKRTRKELTKHAVKISVIDKSGLKKNKMNSILAVGNASSNPPYLLVLSYKPNVKPKKKIALVGKGLTYDSGGLSIKSTAGMLEMKADMAGAATVIGTVMAAARNKLPVELIAVIPAVENMISGSSYKPGDIITSYSGKTILVKDTDAEGRIVLADALHYAGKQKPQQIIDFATLTGAVAVALGLFTAGVFSKNDDLSNRLVQAGDKVNERVWRLPFNDDFKSLLDTDIADISNLGPRWGGAITAGKFLEFFVPENIPYAHIDLAGPALEHKFRNYTEKWCTGFGVRLMHEYLSNI